MSIGILLFSFEFLSRAAPKVFATGASIVYCGERRKRHNVFNSRNVFAVSIRSVLETAMKLSNGNWISSPSQSFLRSG
jgi:hypothetical protein